MRSARWTAALGLALAMASGAAAADAMPSRPADAFVEAIGVNVHAHTHYEAHHEAVKAKLRDLGVRHVRDGTTPTALRYAGEFFRDLGIRTTFITGRRVGGQTEWKSPLDPAKIDAEIAGLRAAAPAIAAIEGPNEYDLFHDDREPDWPAARRRYHQAVVAKVKADPALRHLPVIAPSLTSEKAYEALGSMDEWIDFACIHLYQSTRHPGTLGWGDNGYGSIDWALARLVARQSPARKPVISTEAGYLTRTGDALSEAADGIYTPRMFAEFFRRGFARTFKYELFGDEYGLLREDLSERPAFAAMKNLIALMRDPGPAFSPAALRLTVTGPPDLRQMLFQKRDGTFLLMLWREVSVWEPNAKKDLDVSPTAVALTFDEPVRRADVYEPNASAQPRETHADPKRLEVLVAGRLLVVAIQRQAISPSGSL